MPNPHQEPWVSGLNQVIANDSTGSFRSAGSNPAGSANKEPLGHPRGSLLVGVVQRIPRPKAPPWDRRVALGCLFRGLFVSGALPPGPRDLCRPSFCLRADRRFCGWAAPIVSAKPGLGGRSSFAVCFGGFAPGPPRPLSPFLLSARRQKVLRMGWAHCIRKTRARRSEQLRCFFRRGALPPGPPGIAELHSARTHPASIQPSTTRRSQVARCRPISSQDQVKFLH